MEFRQMTCSVRYPRHTPADATVRTELCYNERYMRGDTVGSGVMGSGVASVRGLMSTNMEARDRGVCKLERQVRILCVIG